MTKRDRIQVAQVVDLIRFTATTNHLTTGCSECAAVEVVVAEHEVDRNDERVLQGFQLPDNVGAFRDVATQDHSVAVLCCDETEPAFPQ